MKLVSLCKIFVLAMFISLCFFVTKIHAADELPPLISMDLQDASIKDVLKILSVQSGMNFIASEAVKDRKLTLYLEKVELREALDKIFKANNLSYEMNKDGNIIIVKDWGKPQLETETRVFYLKHATVSSSSLKEEEANTIRPGQDDSSNGSSSGSSSSASSSSSSSSGGQTTTGKWGVEDDAGITKVITKILSDQGSVIEDFRTNSLIVTDVPSKMVVIARVIASLDISVTQIMLEVEMLDVSKNVIDNMGIKYGQTPLSIAISGAQASLGFPYHSWAKVISNGTMGSIDINNGLNGTVPYKAQLDWLSTQTDTKYLARPRILTLNNETAEIKIVTNEAIGVKVTTSATGGATGTTVSEAERFETGVSLRVTPQVDSDSGEITMFIYPEVSEASTTPTTIDTGTGKPSTFYNPEIRSAKTTVRIKDGETVVIGGLIRNQSAEVITKLPVLGDIPLIGGLFRHKSQNPDKQRELLVFITPRIVKNGDSQISKAAADQKVILPLREQAVVTNMGRQQSIGNYLSNFERQR